MNLLSNGYYLSVYCSIDPILNHYDRAGFTRHDHNISLWKKKESKIKLVHHWELERLTGRKHHHASFFSKDDFKAYVSTLLAQYHLKWNDIQQIIGTPGITTDIEYYNDDFGENLTYHAAAHLFSSVLMDSELFYNEYILALSLDGGSDVVVDNNVLSRCNFMGAYSKKGKMEYFPISSPGLYWIIASEMFKLQEGSLMALAYASKSRVLEDLYKKDDIVHALNFNDARNTRNHLEQIKNTVFSYTEADQGTKFNFFDVRFSEEENKISMVMKIIQELSIEMVELHIDKAIEMFDLNPEGTYISLSGGYALNCPTNTHLMKKYKFKGQLIPPCVNDGGQAIGMGLYYFYKKMGFIDFKLGTPYYGDFHENIELLVQNNYFKDFIESIEYSTEKFVDDITESPILWYDGRSEIGPRALGHRSILADPRSNRSKELLNLYKQRQWWRPVAPIILEESLDDWFEYSFKSPYMLNNFVVKELQRSKVPAIIHLDHTARVQSVNSTEEPRLYQIIKQFYERTGVPILCNTSLNDNGEPIVNTIFQAINFALRKKIKVVYFNGSRISLINHERFECKVPEERDDAIFRQYDVNEMLKYNPHNLSGESYFIYLCNPELHQYQITDEQDAEKIRKIASRIIKNNRELFY